MKFVAYYRVSTDRQGMSGLGLDAQRAAVARHIGVGLQQVEDHVGTGQLRRGRRRRLGEQAPTAMCAPAATDD